MPFTKRITIERYKEPGEYGGLIEGETDDGRRWIMYVDPTGSPSVFWPDRQSDGAVVGSGIPLDRQPGQFSGVFHWLGVQDDADSWDEHGPLNEEVVSAFPVWHPGIAEGENLPEGPYPPNTMRGVIFAVVPDGGSAPERMRRFLEATCEGFGMGSGAIRRSKIEEILDSGTPEDVVTRFRAALTADLSSVEAQACIDHKTTHQASVLGGVDSVE